MVDRHGPILSLDVRTGERGREGETHFQVSRFDVVFTETEEQEQSCQLLQIKWGHQFDG